MNDAKKMLEAAQEYAALGWPVFPCRFNKEPYTKNGVLDATTDKAQIEKWWDRWPGANIGLACGDAGLLVLDYDPGSVDPGLVQARTGAPETALVAKTPRGGLHHYYSLDPGDDPVPNSANRVAEHVDVRSFHGYVLLPPSRTADGAYTWESRKRPARRSDALLEAAGRGRDRDVDHDTWYIEPDLPDNMTLARQWLRGERVIGSSTCRPAIQGAGGDNATYAAAAMMKSCGLSEGTALEVMWEEYNPRCEPPWDYEALAGKVQNGYEYNTSPPGNVTPAYHVAKVAGLFQPAVEEELGEGVQVSSGRFRFVDRDGLQAIAPPEWLLPDALPEDAFAMLVGRPGSYKTALALDMALTVATGGGALRAGDWRGMWDAPRWPGPVLYVAGEGRSGLRKRVEAWETLHLGGDKARDFVLADPVPHIHEGGIEAFCEGARKLNAGYRLVVLDTVARAMQGTNENTQENATALTKMIDHLRRDLGCTVLALHHSGHDNQERGRGSSAFEGDADTVLASVMPENAKLLTAVKMTKQKDWEAWSRSHWASMEEVEIDGRTALVATRGEAPKGEERAVMERRITIATVDRFVMDVLRSNPMKEFSLAELARRVAHHTMKTEGGDEIELGVGESTLRRDGPTGLKTLRAPGSGALTQPMYDAVKDRWRYSPPAAFSPRT